MKKTLITLVAALMCGGAFAQNVFPVTGLVTVDSLKVNGETELNSNVKVGEDLHVTGAGIFEGKGSFQGPVYMDGIETSTDLEETLEDNYILIKKDGGAVQKATIVDLLGIGYKSPCKTNENGVVMAPTWQNGPNKIFTPCPEVNVGIGTDAPTHKLQVQGTIYGSRTAQFAGNVGIGVAPSQFSRLYVNNPTLAVGVQVNMIGSTFENARLMYMEYTNETAEILRVSNPSTSKTPFLLKANGEMIIESSSRRILHLEANGLLRARRVKVDQDTWADYVFEKEYKLMPLNELDAFVKENKHLPNIPSTAEVKENGVDVAEMNMLLLEKVEMLTLYMIEQNNQSLELKAKIEKLQTEINELKSK